jgi:hypothetical protein
VYKIDRLTRSLADFAKSVVYKENQWLTVSNLAKSYRSISKHLYRGVSNLTGRPAGYRTAPREQRVSVPPRARGSRNLSGRTRRGFCAWWVQH